MGSMTEEKFEEVVAWLRSPKAEHLRTDHKNGGGFTIFEKARIRTKKGESQSAVEWLEDMGFEDKMVVGSYRVVYSIGNKQFPDSFAFFLTEKPVEVPEF